MSAIIYYFTSTGNSLAAARRIAEEMDAELLPMASLMAEERIKTGAETVGLVFPVYYASNESGVPLIVQRFVSKLDVRGGYVFAVCTSGYTPGETLGNLDKLVRERGGKLSAGFVLNMSHKSLGRELRDKVKKPAEAKNTTGAGYSEALDAQIDRIAETVRGQREAKIETRSLWGKILNAPLRVLMKPIFRGRYKKLSGTKGLPFEEMIPYADRSFRIKDTCTGCGTCQRVCPVGNITIVDGKPVWQHHCETCYACYQWCPRGAIYGDIVAYNDRHHHPDVKLSDLIK